MFYWWKVQKKKTVYWSLKHWIYFTPVQASLLNSFFKILNYTCRCSWSEVCMILAFPPHPLAHLLFSDNLLQSPVNSNFWLIGSWLHSQRSCIYNGPVYSGHPETVTDQLPQNFQLASLYFLQCWPVYSGHPASNNHLAISQEWPLYTGLTVCTFALNIASWYQNWN